MRKPAILDCTLRDGGYMNDWQFSLPVFSSIVQALDKSNVEYIECGYLDLPNDDISYGGTRFKGYQAFQATMQNNRELSSLRAKLFLMGDYGKFDPFELPPVTEAGNRIFGIRYAFHKEDYQNSITEMEHLCKLGYAVCVQPMVTSRYSEVELLDLMERIKGLDVFAFYMVDSFGSLSLNDIRRFYYLIAPHVSNDVCLGFHAHNNLQLAFSNAMEWTALCQRHQSIIDCSVFGMGRGAGNLNTEIFANYLSKIYSAPYDLFPMLQVIDDHLEPMYRKQSWGFSAAHFISASVDCHPNYATYLGGKKNLSVVSIKQILDNLTSEQSARYDEDVVHKLYENFQLTSRGETRFDSEPFFEQKILVIAPGPSLNESVEIVRSLIENERPVVIALNHIPSDLPVDFFFFSNQKRYLRWRPHIQNLQQIVITSNLNDDEVTPDRVASFPELIGTTQGCDNAAVLLLALLQKCQVSEVHFAGLDGYTMEGENYSRPELESGLSSSMMMNENKRVQKYIDIFAQAFGIHFLTPSRFASSNCSQTTVREIDFPRAGKDEKVSESKNSLESGIEQSLR